MLIDFRLLWSRRRHEGKVAAEPGGHRVIYWQLLQPLCAALLVVLVAACKTSTGLVYKPPFIPVTFSINSTFAFFGDAAGRAARAGVAAAGMSAMA